MPYGEQYIFRTVVEIEPQGLAVFIPLLFHINAGGGGQEPGHWAKESRMRRVLQPVPW